MIPVRLFRRTRDGGVEVFAKPRDRSISNALIAGGAIAVVVGAVLYFSVVFTPESISWYISMSLEPLGMSGVMYGFLFRKNGQGSHFFRERTVKVQEDSGTLEHRYDDFVAVKVGTDEVAVMTSEGSYDETYYFVELVLAKGGARKAVDSALSVRGKGPDDNAKNRQPVRALPALRISSHKNPDQIRQLSESIAREMDCAHVDVVGDDDMLRTVKELDQPLTEQLGYSIALPPSSAVDPPPHGSVTTEDKTTTLQFRSGHIGLVVFLAVSTVVPMGVAMKGVFGRLGWSFIYPVGRIMCSLGTILRSRLSFARAMRMRSSSAVRSAPVRSF